MLMSPNIDYDHLESIYSRKKQHLAKRRILRDPDSTFLSIKCEYLHLNKFREFKNERSQQVYVTKNRIVFYSL